MGQLALSGTISLNDLHTEVGGTSGTECSLDDTDIKQLAYKSSSADSSLADYYGTFWHKDTITINCSLCSYTLTAFPGSQYQFNYLKLFKAGVMHLLLQSLVPLLLALDLLHLAL